MISTDKLIELFKKALNEGWGYIYGAKGGTWTKAQQKSATREQTIKWGSKWIGKRVADCSGLFYWAFNQLGGYMYHGSNTMYKKYSTSKGKLSGGKRTDGKELKPGSAVYKYDADTEWHHVGLYIGNGEVIEAKGTYYGVVKSSVKDWYYWSELKGVNYGADEERESMVGLCEVTAVKGSGVNVRAKASTSSTKLATLAVGTPITVLEENNGWCKISYTNTGYMMSDFINKIGGESSGESNL